jgi:hypothetical protein
VGNETVNGRSAVKDEATNSGGEPSSVRLDPKLRFPVKRQGKSSAGELRNIQEGAQSASLFEIPSPQQDGHGQHDAAALPVSIE